MKKAKRYGNILTLATLQFNGHCLQYLIENSEKLAAFYILPRNGKVKNFVEFYVNSKLLEKRDLDSPKNIFLAYIFFYIQYLQILFKYFSSKEKVYFFNTLPVFFFFNSIVKLFRNMEIVYWVQDYWPMNDLSIRIFRRLMHHYHDHTRITIYLTDRINRKMNGRILSEKNKKTVMWGVDSKNVNYKRFPKKTIWLCFIGVMAQWQNIDFLLSLPAQNKNVNLKLIGSGDLLLVNKYKKMINEFKIQDRVYFPNEYYYGKQLLDQIKGCQIGIVLYEKNPNVATYFADPSKVKQYAEFGLPIIMTDAAEIAKYIKNFKAGIIVDKDIKSIDKAILDIKNNYQKYIDGLKKFNENFDYRTYYQKAFKFLEEK